MGIINHRGSRFRATIHEDDKSATVMASGFQGVYMSLIFRNKHSPNYFPITVGPHPAAFAQTNAW